MASARQDAGKAAAASMEPLSKQPRLEQQQPCSFQVKLLNEHAKAPQRGSSAAAGYDLCSSEDTVIPARGRKLVKTGIAIHTPPGTYGRVAPRSGLAVNHFIDVGAGVIDEDYRGEVRVLLFNHADTDFTVNKGDRIAQLVLECIKTPDVEIVEDLDATDRGAGGFGSTGGYTGNTGPTS